MNIDSKQVLYSSGKNDEYRTTRYAVDAILEYIPAKVKTVWCPFDTDNSEFVKRISKVKRVVYSHIDFGQSFFEYEPPVWDAIISNPPFTNKRRFFERALSFNKPFALIMANTWLNDAAPKQLFKDKELQLLMFDKRMRFINLNGEESDKITFSSSYFCHNFLPKQIIMKELEVT